LIHLKTSSTHSQKAGTISTVSEKIIREIFFVFASFQKKVLAAHRKSGKNFRACEKNPEIIFQQNLYTHSPQTRIIPPLKKP